MTEKPTHATFEHPAFDTMGEAVFRLTQGDRLPALAMRLDPAEIVVPLRVLGPMLAIRPDSADGRMLHLVEQSLRILPAMRLGDALPLEVLTGEASWTPAPRHRRIAAQRLQRRLLAWAFDTIGLDVPLDDAMRQVAASIGVATGEEAAARLERLAAELAYVEALRERLLVRVLAMVRALMRLPATGGASAAARRETLVQVLRLAEAAASDMVARFNEVDQVTEDLAASLRAPEDRGSAIAPHRDRLYGSLLAWDALLRLWDRPRAPDDERVWKAVDAAYRFLAPRYMPVQEWQPTGLAPDRTGRKVLVW